MTNDALGSASDELASRERRPAISPMAHSTLAEGLPRAATESRAFVNDDIIAKRYRIVRFIAGGAMGEVYEAHDLVLDVRLALKTLRWERAGDTRAEGRLRREIALAHEVTHPNVARVFDVGFHEYESGTHPLMFLTMELLLGSSLADRLAATPLSFQEIFEIASGIARALDAAHAKKVVHRDLKPSNVLLVPDAEGGLRVVVADFGLALRWEDSGAGFTSSLSRDARVVGTPAYMSPEQVNGQPVSPRSDLYAFGIVLYEMASGQLPFRGENILATITMRLTEEPPRPSSRGRALPDGWDDTILRCLARAPADRFATAGEVVAALNGSRRVQAAKWARASALALALLAAVSAGAVAWRGHPTAATTVLQPSPSTIATEPAASSGLSARPSIAVLPIRTSTGSVEPWLLSALREMLHAELAALPTLRVADASSTSLLDENEAPWARESLDRARRLLAVDSLVDGSVAAIGVGKEQRLRLEIRVTRRGEPSTTIYTGHGSEGDLFEMVEAAAERVRDQLGVPAVAKRALSPARASLPAGGSATKSYLRGLGFMQVHEMAAARDAMAKVVALEPSFGSAYNALAIAHDELGYTNLARVAIDQALSLAEGSTREEYLALVARRAELFSDWTGASKAHEDLVASHPDDVGYGLGLAQATIRMGDLERTHRVLEGLRNLPSPAGLDPRIVMLQAHVADLGGEPGAEAAFADEILVLATSTGARYLEAEARWYLAQARTHLEPRQGIEDLRALEGTFLALKRPTRAALTVLVRASASIELGDAATARADLERGRQLVKTLDDKGLMRRISMTEDLLHNTALEPASTHERRTP